MTSEFPLPDSFRQLVEAQKSLARDFQDTGLKFSLDGNLIGDIGEALAMRYFGLVPCVRKRAGIDGTVGQKTVQVKASASKRGAAFRWVDENAEHLLVFCIDPNSNSATLIFNGPQSAVLKEPFPGQKSISKMALQAIDVGLKTDQRLPIVKAD